MPAGGQTTRIRDAVLSGRACPPGPGGDRCRALKRKAIEGYIKSGPNKFFGPDKKSGGYRRPQSA